MQSYGFSFIYPKIRFLKGAVIKNYESDKESDNSFLTGRHKNSLLPWQEASALDLRIF
jgi:hypothetical protein